MTVVFAGIVLSLVGAGLAIATYWLLRDRDARIQYGMTVRAIRWWMLPAALIHLVVVIAISYMLISLVPVLRIGWWMLLGGSGNIALGQAGRPGRVWELVALVIPLWVLILIPRLAYQEEISFRYGCEDESRYQRLRQQVVFGLTHAVAMGVPIAAGVALIGSGILYQRVYLTSLRRLLDRTELVEVASTPAKLAYPPIPEGPYDIAAWDAHHKEFARVVEQNQVLLKQWFADRAEQGRLRQAQVDDLRENAAAKAAALHAVSNWLVVGLLIVLLAIGKV